MIPDEFTHLAGCGMKIMRPLFKSEMLIYRSNLKMRKFCVVK